MHINIIMLSEIFFKSQTVFFFLLSLVTFGVVTATEPAMAARCIVIDKAKGTLIMLNDGKPVADFPAAFGLDPDSDKQSALDGATPEGLYFITYKKAKSRFHRFLGISYPNLAKAMRALEQGVISAEEYKRIYQATARSRQAPCDTRLGCGIGIHGGGVYRSFGKTFETNWTEGCIALNNKDIEKVFAFCRPGDPVVILNSRRNLYGIIRPFAQIKDVNGEGMPNCPDGICTYQAELSTTLGRMVITVNEGKDYSRILKVTVYKDGGGQEKPLLVIVDRNADGHIGVADSVEGPIAEGRTPDAVYELARYAAIKALRNGNVLNPGSRPRPPKGEGPAVPNAS